MFPTTIKFEVVQRKVNDKNNWALQVNLGTGGWVIWDWPNKPTTKQIQSVKDIALRGMEVYHKAITFPGFKLKVE